MVSVACHPGVARALLVQRLKWPIAVVRWRAAREIRDLLRTTATRPAMTVELLGYLDQCKTESEICSILGLLMLTEDTARPTRDEVVRRIRFPSILADFLLEKTFGPGMGMGGWHTAHSGLVPDEFEPDSYFLEHKTAELAPIFSNELLKLESTGLPFTRQWAYEWRNLREELGTRFSHFPYYFDGYGETRAGIIGQYQQRQTEVFRSAHIRTFALAVTEWGMPLAKATEYLLDHIPAIGGLFDLEPGEKPSCVGILQEQCLQERSDLKEILSEWLRCDRQRRSRCVSIVSPSPIEVAQYGDISISAYLVTPDFEIQSGNKLFQPFEYISVKEEMSIDGIIKNTTLDETRLSGKSGWAAPVCYSFLSFPYGYWNSEYFSVGLPIVTSYCLGQDAAIRARDGMIRLIGEDGTVLATTKVWNEMWTSSYVRGGTTRCGAVAELACEQFDALPVGGAQGLKLAWFIKTRVWRRPTDHGEYVLEDRHALVLDDTV